MASNVYIFIIPSLLQSLAASHIKEKGSVGLFWGAARKPQAS